MSLIYHTQRPSLGFAREKEKQSLCYIVQDSCSFQQGIAHRSYTSSYFQNCYLCVHQRGSHAQSKEGLSLHKLNHGLLHYKTLLCILWMQNKDITVVIMPAKGSEGVCFSCLLKRLKQRISCFPTSCGIICNRKATFIYKCVFKIGNVHRRRRK